MLELQRGLKMATLIAMINENCYVIVKNWVLLAYYKTIVIVTTWHYLKSKESNRTNRNPRTFFIFVNS